MSSFISVKGMSLIFPGLISSSVNWNQPKIQLWILLLPKTCMIFQKVNNKRDLELQIRKRIFLFWSLLWSLLALPPLRVVQMRFWENSFFLTSKLINFSENKFINKLWFMKLIIYELVKKEFIYGKSYLVLNKIQKITMHSEIK